MGKAVRNAVLSAAVALALYGPAAANDLRLTGVDLTTTSGTLQLHRVRAASAIMNPESTQVLTDELEFKADTPERGSVVARAPRGIVVVDSSRPPAEEELPRPSLQQITDYRADFQRDATYGDVLLDGGDGNAEAVFGEEGFLRSREIIWSERYGRVLVPHRFTQQTSTKDGNTFDVSGIGLAVDREFNEWTYFGTDETPSMIVIERSNEQPQTTQGTDSQ